MRYVFVLFAWLGCTMQGIAQPDIKFDDKIKKFDEVEAGEILSFDFLFENKGDQPLIITDIKVSCSCTVPEWPEEPIKPGQKDTIHVSFDTAGKVGWQYRNLEIISNSKRSPDVVKFRGKVINEDWPEK